MQPENVGKLTQIEQEEDERQKSVPGKASTRRPPDHRVCLSSFRGLQQCRESEAENAVALTRYLGGACFLPRSGVYVEPAGGGCIHRGERRPLSHTEPVIPHHQAHLRSGLSTAEILARLMTACSHSRCLCFVCVYTAPPTAARQVRVPMETKAKDVKCVIKPNSIDVAVATLPEAEREVLKGTLFQTVTADECSWTVASVDGGRVLQIMLTKQQDMRWLGVLR